MAREFARTAISGLTAKVRHLAILAVGLSVSGCAQVGVPELPDFMASAPPADGAAAGGSNLQTATAYWGKRFQKHPRNLENALNYAKNLKAMGEKRRAFAVLQRASVFHSDSRELASEYGRLALDLGQVKVADKVLALADDPGAPDWRVINARATVQAKQGQYAKAIPLYQSALQFSEGQPSVLNNLALAHAMNGDPQTAESLLREAVAQGKATKKIRQNLSLVLGLQGKYDEATQISARDVTSHQATADTSVIRNVVGLPPTAMPVPAVTQVATGLKPSTQDAGAAGSDWASDVAVSTASR